MTEKFSLEWQIEQVKNKYDNLQIKIVEKTKNMMLLEVTTEEHKTVHIAFYSYYIACSGEFGEWQFYGPEFNGKIELDADYEKILNKISDYSKKYVFEFEYCASQFKKWGDDFVEEYRKNRKENYGMHDKFLWDLFDELKKVDTSEEHEYIISLKQLTNFLREHGYDTYWYPIWNFGKIYDENLIIQLVILKNVIEYLNKKSL